MTVLVDVYEVREHRYQLCHECEFVAAWEVKPQVTPEIPITGFGCDEHLGTVIFLVEKGKAPVTPPPNNPGGLSNPFGWGL